MTARPKVYIDGKEGTTGLQIYDRLAGREDIELLLIDPAKRRDYDQRKKLMNQADLVFFCLPDDGAREAAAMVEASGTRIIDASTAHRVSAGWVYGFAELFSDQREKIRTARRVANPGCHATGFLAAAAPLVAVNVLPGDYPMTCFSLTGYSGGGKKLISEYEAPGRDTALDAPNLYALGLEHKHLPEMTTLAGLDRPPVFVPVLGDIYKGMATAILLHNRYLKGQPTAEELCHILTAYYAKEPLVTVTPFGGETPRLAANSLAGLDRLELTVTGNRDRTLVTARFDNLGKGASGAAVQNMNIMLGLDELAGLRL